ncbi:MAG: PLDc N-terminal domain-containing protein [Defluviitaleaceae bacterium]|nr:PLDc N-terminal domain-containing protein [Defluviitaleaceae bacterium]
MINIGSGRYTMSEAIEVFGASPLVLLISGILLGVVAIAFVTFYVLWIYNDAKERTDSPAMWTLVAVFVPLFIGLIIYLTVGREKGKQSSNRYLVPFLVLGGLFIVLLAIVIGFAVSLIVQAWDMGYFENARWFWIRSWGR